MNIRKTFAAVAAAGLLGTGLACGAATAPEVKPTVTPQIVYVEVTSTPVPTNTPDPELYIFSNGVVFTCSAILAAYKKTYEANKGSRVAVHRARKFVADTVGVMPLEAQKAYDTCLNRR